MKRYAPFPILFLLLAGSTLCLHAPEAIAALSGQGILDQVATKYFQEASKWQGAMMNAALFLFWTLGTISVVWTGVQMVFRQADPGEVI